MFTYPMEIDITGNITIPDRQANIEGQIELSLLTALSERAMFPEFGSKLSRIKFLNKDLNLGALAIEYTREAIKKDVPDVDIAEIEPVLGSDESITVNIKYIDLATGTVEDISVPI